MPDVGGVPVAAMPHQMAAMMPQGGESGLEGLLLAIKSGQVPAEKLIQLLAMLFGGGAPGGGVGVEGGAGMGGGGMMGGGGPQQSPIMSEYTGGQ